MSDPRHRARIKHIGPVTFLDNDAGVRIASTIITPNNPIPLFPYIVGWKYHKRLIYACDQRMAQTFGYHLLKAAHPRDPVKRHLIHVSTP